MTDHTKLNSANSVLLVVVTLGLDVALIPRWGVIGAALASAISTVLINVLCLLEVLMLLRMLPYDRSFIKPLAAGLGGALVALLLNQHLAIAPLLQLVIGGTALWSAYLVILLVLKLPKDDLIIINYLRIRLNGIASYTSRVAH